MRYLEPARNILLTGAGFTKTFGGFLAAEMWAAILNELPGWRYPSLREFMFDDPTLDFERIYDTVLRDSHLTDSVVLIRPGLMACRMHWSTDHS